MHGTLILLCHPLPYRREMCQESIYYSKHLCSAMEHRAPQKFVEIVQRVPEYRCFSIRKLNRKFDILNQDTWSVYPRLVRLLANDGNNMHMVTIVGGWIFDSNIEYCLPLTKWSLDWCCIDGFNMILEGWEIFEMENMKNKKGRCSSPSRMWCLWR